MSDILVPVLFFAHTNLDMKFRVFSLYVFATTLLLCLENIFACSLSFFFSQPNIDLKRLRFWLYFRNYLRVMLKKQYVFSLSDFSQPNIDLESQRFLLHVFATTLAPLRKTYIFVRVMFSHSPTACFYTACTPSHCQETRDLPHCARPVADQCRLKLPAHHRRLKQPTASGPRVLASCDS